MLLLKDSSLIKNGNQNQQSLTFFGEGLTFFGEGLPRWC